MLLMTSASDVRPIVAMQVCLGQNRRGPMVTETGSVRSTETVWVELRSGTGLEINAQCADFLFLLFFSFRFSVSQPQNKASTIAIAK